MQKSKYNGILQQITAAVKVLTDVYSYMFSLVV